MKISFPESAPVGEIGNDIAGKFAAGAQFVHVEALPILDMDDQRRNDYIIGVASTIGELTLTGDKAGTELWRLDSITSPNANQIPFHTDNPFYEKPEDLVSFWNIRSSKDGGENIILPVGRLLEWISAKPELAETLEELTTTNVAFNLKDNYSVGVILDSNVGKARFDQKYIDPTHASLGVRFTQILDEAKILSDEIKLSAGDALFFNNRSTLHARAPYSDPDRLSIRVRIAGR